MLTLAAPDTGISVERFLLLLAVILISAKILGELAERTQILFFTHHERDRDLALEAAGTRDGAGVPGVSPTKGEPSPSLVCGGRTIG